MQSSLMVRNINRLFVLRGLIFCGAAVALIVANYWLQASPPWIALAAILGLSATCNLLLQRAFTRSHRKPALLAQLIVDIAALGALLYLAGGASDPFVWLLLLPIVIAAIILSRTGTWMIAAVATATYSALMWFYRPLPHVHMAHEPGFAVHILGMWIGFILSAAMIAHFLSGMAANVRERDAALARAREQALRDERLISLGALAASAAHELGTPLGTLAALTEEAAADLGERNIAAAKARLELMNEQVARCKRVIAGMATAVGAEAAQGGRPLETRAFVNAIIAEWREQHAGIKLSCCLKGTSPGPRVVAEKSLIGALTNILDNAADASPEDVAIEADWSDEALAIRVFDRGHGFAPELRERVGKAPVSAKPGGHGLGLYLSHGIVERLGGKLSIQPRAGGGTAVQVELPLAGLRV